MKTACIYHSVDLDGYSSAAIVKHWHNSINDYPDNVGKGTIDFIGYNYGKPIPDLSEYDRVIMCDISFPKEEMFKLGSRLQNNFIWIDHHISAIKEYKNDKAFSEIGVSIDCIFNGLRAKILNDGNCEKIAACELTWLFFFPNKTMPISIVLLGEYDSWRNGDKDEWDNCILPFQFGMRQICNSLETFPMQILDNELNLTSIINNGKLILNYQKQQNIGLCRLAFEKQVFGLRAICLNTSGCNSQAFESVWDETKHDIMVSFYYNGKHDKYTVSLYSPKPEVDCSVLAKSMGGGGHKGAAGFQIDNFKDLFSKKLA